MITEDLPRLISRKFANNNEGLRQDFESIANEAYINAMAKVKDQHTKNAFISQAIEWKIISEIRKQKSRRKNRHKILNPEIYIEISDIEQQECVDKILSNLTPLNAKIFRLYVLEEYTFREIGRKIDLSYSAVAHRFYQSLEILKRIIDDPNLAL